MSSSIRLPDGFNVIFVNIKRWHGKRKLNNKDLGIEQIDKRLANLGNVSMIDPKMVNQFRNIGNQALKVCSKYGVKFGDGWAVHDDVHQLVLDELKQLQSLWYATKREVMSKYEINVQLWANEAETLKQGFGEVVLRGAYTASYVENQIQFEIHGAEQIVEGLGNNLISEIATKFKSKHEQLLKRFTDNKCFNITRRDLMLLNEVKEKLLINALLSPAATPLLNFISDMLDDAGDEELSDDFCDQYVKNVALLTTPELIYGLSSSAKTDTTTAPQSIGIMSVLDSDDSTTDIESETETETDNAVDVEQSVVVEEEPTDEVIEQVIVHDEYDQAPLNDDLKDVYDDFEDF